MTEPCSEYEERAAILEYMAGMTRKDAEQKAREQLEQRGGKDDQ